MREHGPTYPLSIKVKSSPGLSDIIALNSPAKPITSPAFERLGTKDIFACVKLPSGYKAGDLMKGVGRTGPNESSVSRVKLGVLCRMPGPTYWMAAAAGIVIKKLWFDGISCITLNVKVDVLATHIAPPHNTPCCGQSCTFTGITLRFTVQFQWLLFDMLLKMQLWLRLYSPAAPRLKLWRCILMMDPALKFIAAINDTLISVSVLTFSGKKEIEDSLNAPTGRTYWNGVAGTGPADAAVSKVIVLWLARTPYSGK
jgi:hypothetical protein